LQPTTLGITEDVFFDTIVTRYTSNVDKDTGEITYEHAKGLGKTAWILYDYLMRDGSWMTRRNLAMAIGMHPSTVGKAIKRMVPDLIETGKLGIRAIPVSSSVAGSIAADRNVSGAFAELEARCERMRYVSVERNRTKAKLSFPDHRTHDESGSETGVVEDSDFEQSA
jgi:hypothetical protein